MVLKFSPTYRIKPLIHILYHLEAKPPSGRVLYIMRKIQFSNGEYYHIFNRGVDKRVIFNDHDDIERFFQSMKEFNHTDPIGSIYENSFKKEPGGSTSKFKKEDNLVNFICYCLNPNHYHFILEQVSDNGIEKFMHRVGTGYTMFFNRKYKRNGALFQGVYKAVYIDSNEQLLHTSVYVNLNNKIHSLGGLASKSSWDEYMKDDKNENKNNKNSKDKDEFCEKNIILDQFKNRDEYKNFAKDALVIIKENKDKGMKEFLI